MSAIVKTYVQRYARNLRGFDYVASDVHGCFSSLKFALQRVGFSPARDRLFCVGDLVDRGPSPLATKYLFFQGLRQGPVAVIPHLENQVLVIAADRIPPTPGSATG